MIRRAAFLLAVGTLVAAPKAYNPIDANDLNNFAMAYNSYIHELKENSMILNAKETDDDRRGRQELLWKSVVSSFSRLNH